MSQEKSKKKHTAIILGAGMAGVKAGIELHAAGIDSIILEARDRLGGRILTNRDGLGSYDFGASWFHDSLVNPLFKKSLEAGDIEYYFDDGKSVFVTPEGCYDDNLRLQPVIEEMATYSQLVYDQSPHRKDVSLHTLAAEYIWKNKQILTKEQIKYGGPGLRCLTELWHGISWDMLSAKHTFGSDDSHLGRNVFVVSGYDKVFQNELENYPANQIHKNVQINTISRLSSGEVCVTSTKNENFYCDYLLVTIPQSILTLPPSEKGSIHWNPPLPESITNHFSRTHYGSLGKIFFEFSEAFWPTDIDRFMVVSKPDDMIIDSINSNTPPPLSFPNLPTNYKLKVAPRPWDFPSVVLNYHRINNKPVLIFLTQAPLSEWLERHQDDAWQIMKPVIAKLSNRDVADVPAPSNTFVTNWTNDEFIRGSYGTLSVGDDYEGMKAFIKGLDNVRFAGAETVHGSANGCVHGAWNSGLREANYIIDKLKNRKSQ